MLCSQALRQGERGPQQIWGCTVQTFAGGPHCLHAEHHWLLMLQLLKQSLRCTEACAAALYFAAQAFGRCCHAGGPHCLPACPTWAQHPIDPCTWMVSAPLWLNSMHQWATTPAAATQRGQLSYRVPFGWLTIRPIRWVS